MLSLFLKPLLRRRITVFLSALFSRSMSSQRMFQLKLDPLTGNSQWVVIQEEDDEQEDQNQSFNKQQKHLLANTSYLDMLNDSPRNAAFRRAIDKTITRPCHVLDIGAGTGLLSMMAARAMGLGDPLRVASGSEGLVTACESYLPMVKLMRKVLRANGMERNVRLINKRSDELEVGIDMPSRADVLVSEILDSELLGEGLIPSLQHAHENLLVENPETVPYRATIYAQLVESTYLWGLHDLFHKEAKASDGIHLVPEGMDTISSIRGQQLAMHCDALKGDIKVLSEPFKTFDFDFWKRPDSAGKTELRIKATVDGTAHAIVSWWLLQLDREGTIFYSTEPKWINSLPEIVDLESSSPRAGVWCDHWKQCVWFIPEKVSVRKDEEIHLHAVHSDTSISYEVKTPPQATKSTQNCQIILSPEKVGVYGDATWRYSMLKAVKNALQRKVSPLCVIVDDSIFLSVAIAKLAEKSYVMPLFPGLRERGSQYLQLVSAANVFSMDRIEVPKKRKSQLTLHDTHQRKVDLLVGEPFYYGSDNVLPWQNLRFWKERTTFDSVLSEDVIIMPYKGILRGCAMSIPDLWRTRRCLNDIEGFDHSVVNTTLGACGDIHDTQEIPCLPFALWQCGEVKKLSEIVTIMEFDFSKPINPCSGRAQFKFDEPGICHGFALWIDWVMDDEDSIVLSAGPDQRYWKQGVKLLDKPIAIGSLETGAGNCSFAELDVSFDSSADLVIKHSFS